jgi:hypothetical protein
MVLADLEPMFALAAEEPVVYQLSAEAQAGAQGAMAGFDFGKLFSFPDSGWLGELVSRVRRDVEFMGTLDLEDYEEMFTDGWPFQASPSDWAIAMLLIWDHTANVIIIALALILLRVMKHFRRKY